MGQISRKKNFSWNLIFGYANLLLAMTFGLFMVPIYLKYIPTEIYGAWLASGNILVWLVAINPGIGTVMQQQVATFLGQGQLEEVARVIGFGLLVTLLISLLASCLGVVFADEAIAILRLSADVDSSIMVKAFMIAAVSTGILLFSDGIVAIIHALHSSFYVGLTNLISYAAAILATILLLQMDFGILALPYGSMVRAGSVVILNACVLPIKLHKLGIKIALVRTNGKSSMLHLFSYSFIGRLGGIITGNMESVIIARYFGADAVVSIVLTKRIPAVFETVILMIARALCPSISHLKGEGNVESIQNILSRVALIVFWLGGFVLSLVLVFNEAIMGLWVGVHIFPGNYLNAIVCGAVFISMVSHFFLEMSAALGEIKKSGVATFIQSILFIPIVWTSVNLFGIGGVVIGPAIAMASVSGWYYLFLVCKTANFDRHQVKGIAKEIGITGVASFIMVGAFYGMEGFTILELIIYVPVFSVGYFLILLIFSAMFRLELIRRLLAFNLLRRDWING